MAEAGAAVGSRRLYLCTPDRPDLEAFLDACIRGGVDIVQLRDKALDARPLLQRAAVARKVCADHGVPFIVNDRPDLALEAEADGVHVGQDDVPPALARRILGPSAIVGFSTHRAAELDAANAEPIDYVATGPVLHTATHPEREPTGHGYLEYAAERAQHPFFVTGGVTPATLPPMISAGARRFVVVRYLTEADAPEPRARELRQVIDAAWG